jgi:hypothetical protein
MTDFISVVNKYKIHHITIEEYEKYQEHHNHIAYSVVNFSTYLDETLNDKFVMYKDVYFQYNKSEIKKIMTIMDDPFDRNYNDVMNYLYHAHWPLIRGKMIINKCEFFVKNVIIPKYYDELQNKSKPIEQNEPADPTKSGRTASKKKETTKKRTIPLTLKRNVWNKHIGEDIGKVLCLCCKLTHITQMNFSCGHIISEFHGGELKLNNLKPICVSCNSSMGTKNMDEFMEDCGL